MTKRPKEADATSTVQMKTHKDRERESRRSPFEVEQARRARGVFHLDLPKLRVRAFERAPRVSGAVGNLVTDNVERGHRWKPVFRLLFVMVLCCNGHHKHTLKARTAGRGGRVGGASAHQHVLARIP